MSKMMAKLTAIILACALLLGACATIPKAPQTAPETAPEAKPTQAAVQAPAEDPALPTSTPGASASKNSGQDCSNLPLTEAVVAIPGNGTGRPTRAVAIDPASGQQICGYEPIALGADIAARISPDHRYLAAINFTVNSGMSSKIQFVDLTNWSTFTVRYPIQDWVASMVFSPDAAYLALAIPSTAVPVGQRTFSLALVDVGKQAVVGKTTLEFSPHFLQFTPDGKQLIAVGGREYLPKENETAEPDLNAQGVVLAVPDLEAGAWTMPLEGVRDGSYWQMKDQNPTGQVFTSGVQLSPDGRYVHIVHAAEDKLTRVDLQEKKASTTTIQRKLSWIERLLSLGTGVASAKELNATEKRALISPDGKTIYALSLSGDSGEQGYILTSHGVQVIDAATGDEIARVDTPATHMALSPDGEQLYLVSDAEPRPWSEVVAVKDMQALRRFDGSLLSLASRTNGQTVLLAGSVKGGATGMALLDPHSLQASSEWVWKGMNLGASAAAWPER